MEAFLKIVTEPDNIAVVFLFVAVAAVSCLALGEARRNDRITRAGTKDELAERMDR
jgi:hypothetical protein